MKLKALCVLTTLLGNKATASRLIDAFDGMANIEPTYVVLSVEDYLRYPAPRQARVTDAWESRYMARAKMADTRGGPFDILLVNSWEFVTEFRSLARRIPAAALMDAVPSTFDTQLRRRGRGGWKRTLATWIHDIPFSRAVRDFSYFLPMGSDCADALAVRYRVPRDRIAITLAPQDLKFWMPAPKRKSDDFRLLFVANDFARKGGEFLLNLYTTHLAGSCSLTIASNDSALKSRTLPAGVVWRPGLNREEVLQAYRDSDLFLFPTLQDYMPQVLAEALSTGLPCVASDVGGIRDLIRDGETGFLMPYGGDAGTWARRIESLRSDPSALDRLSCGARAFAERNLDSVGFSRLIERVIENLGAASRVASRVSEK